MAIIAPTALTGDLEQYRAQMTAFNSFAQRIQIDVTDGEFVEARTVPLENVWWPKGKDADLHLMIAHPSQHLDTLVKLHPSLVIVHAEVKEDLLPIFQKLRQEGIKVGIALLKSTFPGNVEKFIQLADHVLIFAGDLGKQGSNADMLQIEKVPLVRAIKPGVEIGWDGGANMENIREIAHSDIDVINVGRAVAQASNPAQAYKDLVKEADKRGVRL